MPKMGYTARAKESRGDLPPHLSPRFLSYARTALGRPRSRWCWATAGSGAGYLTLRSSLILVAILYLEPIANGVFDAVFTMGGGAYTECINEKGGIFFVSGCLGAVFTSNLLLIQCRPNQPPLPFINGEHCTGDNHGSGQGYRNEDYRARVGTGASNWHGEA